MRTITSANSVMTLSVPDVQNAPHNVQGYATDDAFDTEQADSAEAIMGVDGKLSAGFTPYITKLMIALQADSPSVDVFDNWLQAQKAANDVFFADVTLALPSVGRLYTFTKCVLTRITQLPAGKKTLQPVKYELSCEVLAPSPLI